MLHTAGTPSTAGKAGVRLRWTLAWAGAAHGALFAWALRAGDSRGVEAQAEPVPALTVETVDIEAPADLRPSTEDTSTRPTEPAAAARETERAPARARVDSAANPGNPSATEGAAVGMRPGDEGGWTFSPTAPGANGTDAAGGGTLAGRALGDAVHAGLQATLREDRAAAQKRELHRRLIPAFSQHDIDLGFVPGQAFATATRAAVPSSRAPMMGHAVLEFQTDAAGALVSVRVVDASSDRADWDDLAADLARDGHLPALSVPAGSSGLAVTVDVTSSVKTASGATPTDRPIAKVLRAINDPFDAVLDAKNPASRVVAARVVDVQAF